MKQRFIQFFVHIAGITPAIYLTIQFILGTLSINPIQALQKQTGVIALVFLLGSLMCTPLSRIFGWTFLNPRRQALGLYGFMYAVIHLSVFLGLDYRFNISQILADVGNKMYILIGLTAFLLLIPLAVTSLTYFKKALGKNWKKLHTLAYVIPIFVLWHYFASVKGNLGTLQGDLGKPLVYTAILVILLAVRLPFIKHLISQARSSKA